MKFYILLFLFFAFVFGVRAQNAARDFALEIGASVEIENLYGRVSVAAEEIGENGETKAFVSIESAKELKDSEIVTKNKDGKLEIVVKPQDVKARVDLIVKVPVRSKISITTRDGEVAVSGNLEKISVTTDTGTISTDVPTEDIRYDLIWTRSRPRFLSDIQLEEVEEKSAGRFGVSGKFGETKKEREKRLKKEGKTEKPAGEPENRAESAEEKETKSARRHREALAEKRVELNFTTGRGIVLLNVPPGEVPADLSERKLTEAAKAIVRSGDSVLSEAIRRTSPKFFAEYAQTLPPRRNSPTLALNQQQRAANSSRVKQVIARVMDANNRSIGGLQKENFTVTEGGNEREIISVRQTNAPFNLVLLLDVSGSVDNYVNFIRKAARQFLDTASPNDKVSIIIFSEDVKQISTFTTDKKSLSESLDTFDAGGATAYYDALAFTLVDTLRPLKGTRAAIISLTDGDDNRSFLPFESLLGSIQESGALIYPLYVPSSLAAAASAANSENTADPLRHRYLGLTSKAEIEGAKLAQVSGGIYYPIQRLSDLQKAYDDIVEQLRTAYTITFRSDGIDAGNAAAPRLRIKTNRENTVVTTGQVFNISSQSEVNFQKNTGKEPEVSDINNSFFRKVSFQAEFQENTEINGEITGIEYKPLLTQTLTEIKKADLDINFSAPSFVLADGQKKIGVSKWVSPKRTRSYPYERVYNTLSQPKKITIIPVLKDEGASGERDFIQWDTISLMSLLDVYVVPAYYADAEKSAKGGKITDQKFDNVYILQKLGEIDSYHSSAVRWNLKQLTEIGAILQKSKESYSKISAKTGVKMHNDGGIDNFAGKIASDVNFFMEFSRQKSRKAQNREFVTLQPKESLSSDTKKRVTITDYLGGKYYFTCDETLVAGDKLYIIEDKHSKNGKMPAVSDIKDGLLKMMLYSNLKNVKIGGKSVAYEPVLRLTGGKLQGAVSSANNEKELETFFALNSLTAKQRDFITKLFAEARANRFVVKLESAAIALLEKARGELLDV